MFNPKAFARNIKTLIATEKNLIQKDSKFLKWKNEPESILELGIGDGSKTKEVILPILPKNVKEYIGADISEVMLNSARETIVYEKFKTLKMDATDKNVPSDMLGRFHHIFSLLFFHYIQDIRQVLQNTIDMLQPGGQLYFHTFDKTSVDDAYDKLDESKWKKYNNRKSLSPFYRCEDPLQEYVNLLKNLGFVDCRFHKIHYMCTYKEEDFDELFSAVNHHLPFVKEEDKSAYIKDYLEEAKKSSKIKVLPNCENNQRYFELSNDIIAGVATKP